MTALQAKHSKQVVDRFKGMLEGALVAKFEQHFDELELLVESAIDAAVLDAEEAIVSKLK